MNKRGKEGVPYEIRNDSRGGGGRPNGPGRVAGGKKPQKTRIGRTYKTPIEAYHLRTGLLYERLVGTTLLSSVPPNGFGPFIVVRTSPFRFQGESALGLKEESNRIARHPPLWLFEGQNVVDFLGEYLGGVQSGKPKNDVRQWCGSPFPDMQPRSVMEYFSPTPRQGPTS